ncbi:MAG: cupin domain-containing protein [Thermoleophilia bacterium]|nr:cupin domain-containing protein [Thermoleophilia bacterium]MDH4344840.1 cupin domain-containing protein [Thermoleophilia bacterium]
MPGPWRTHVDADAWAPMELGGDIVGEVHTLRSDEGARAYEAGLWRVLGELPAPFDYDFELDETIHVLEGGVVIAVDGGPTLALGPGDVASFAAGSRATWRIVRTPFKELFVLS